MTAWKALVACMVLTSGVTASAGELDGTWVMDDEDGRTTLVLRVDAQGAATGRLSGPGWAMAVTGRATGASLDASARLEADPSQTLRFKAQAAQGQLRLTLLDPESGEAIDEHVLRRDGAAPAAPTSPAQPTPPAGGNPLGGANPLGGGGNPLAAPAAPFAGTFEGGGVVLELAAKAPGYEGTLTFQGQRMPCRAAPKGDGLAGTFTASGSEFAFEAARTPQGLRLTSSGQGYDLVRKGGNPLAGGAAPPANPLGSGTGSAPAPAGSADLPVEAKHPMGVGFRMPDGWTSLTAGTALRILAPGCRADDPNLEELHLFACEPISDASITSPDQPGVAQYMDQTMAQSFPALRRTQPPALIDTPAGKAAVMTWTGTSPNGAPVEGKAFVVLVGRTGATLISVATVPKLREREPALRQIAGSFRAIPVEADTRIVGSYYNNGGWRSKDFKTSSDSHSTMTLGADGRFQETFLSYVSTPAGIVENKEARGGTWSAAGGSLTLRYEDGSTAQYGYQLNADGSLTCRSGDGGESVWRRR